MYSVYKGYIRRDLNERPILGALEEKVIKQLEQWFSLNDMDDSGAISIDDALHPGHCPR